MQRFSPNSERLAALARGHVAHALIPAAIFLYYGFSQDRVGTSDSAFYNATVTLFNYMTKTGGIAFAAIAVGCMAGVGAALAADAVAAMLCGLILAGCGTTWLLTEGNQEGLLFALFGCLFIGSGWNSWRLYAANALQSAGHADAPDDAHAPDVESSRQSQFDPRHGPQHEPQHGPQPLAATDHAAVGARLAKRSAPLPSAPASPSAASDPPAEGYLAALANEDERPARADHE